MKRVMIIVMSCIYTLACFSQHTLKTKDEGVLNVKITEISDSTISYQTKSGKNAQMQTVSLDEVESYQLKDGIVRHVSLPKRDTLVSIMIDEESSMLMQEFADNQNKMIAKALKTTGIISMSIGVPCVVAGVAGLLYANMLPNPTAGYTTSQTLAAQDASLQYMSANEYINKLQDYNGKVRTANNFGYLLTGAGAALTIVGVPLYCYGKHIMTLNINYTGNGAGVTIDF